MEERKIKYKFIELSEKGVSFEDIIKFAKYNITSEEICKTIIVRDKKGNNFGFLLKGNQKIDFTRAKEIVGSRINIVSYEDLKRLVYFKVVNVSQN